MPTSATDRSARDIMTSESGRMAAVKLSGYVKIVHGGIAYLYE